MQRVRIGLTGLASVFVLVLLAAAFIGLARDERPIRTDANGQVVLTPTANASDDDDNPKDPLAELGVTPGNMPNQPDNGTATAR